MHILGQALKPTQRFKITPIGLKKQVLYPFLNGLGTLVLLIPWKQSRDYAKACIMATHLIRTCIRSHDDYKKA